jgi:hypothetical protein
MFADPSKLTPLIVLAVCRTVADPALPLTVVWSPVFVPDDVPLNVPDCVASVPRPRLVRAVAAEAKSLRLFAATTSPLPVPAPIAVRAAAASAAVITDLPTDVVSMTCVEIKASTDMLSPFPQIQQRIKESAFTATASKLNKSARPLRPKSLTTKMPQH